MDLTRPLVIHDTFTVNVKFHPRREQEVFGQRVTNLSPDGQAAEATKFYIDGWSGLRPHIVRHLGIPLDGSYAEDEDIEYDEDIARDLWRHAWSNLYMLPILQLSRDMLQVINLEKEDQKKT